LGIGDISTCATSSGSIETTFTPVCSATSLANPAIVVREFELAMLYASQLLPLVRTVSIAEKTARVDLFFEIAAGKIPTIGVGDGGNEIGMGNVASLIKKNLSLTPCVIKTDLLVIATVSNWGAYAITAYLEKLSGKKLLMSYEDVLDYIQKTVEIGSVDGVLKERVVSVDGFGMETEKEIIQALKEAV